MSKPESTFTIHAAKTHLSQLVARAEAGEEIVLDAAASPWQARPAGAGKADGSAAS